MYLGLTPREEEIRAVAREFAEKEVLPGAAERDRTGEFPAALVRRMGELGFYGLPYPKEYGGGAEGTVAYSLAAAEVARCDAAVGLTMAVNATIGTLAVFLFGTEEQKQRWVPGVLQGKLISAFGLTEEGAGSDAAAVKTAAVWDGGGGGSSVGQGVGGAGQWIINGEKIFITNGSVADFVVVAAVTDPELGSRGISCFIVPTDTPGFRVAKKFTKMGLRCSDTAHLIFEDCRVPAANLLGKRGEGLKMFLTVLDTGRVGVAALSVGLAQACLEDSLAYAKNRVQFGQAIGKNQAVAFRLSETATEVEAARLLTISAARARDKVMEAAEKAPGQGGGRFTTEAAMAKMFASETAVRAALTTLQVHAGHGYCLEYRAERLFRDAKLMEIGEGTSEVQRLVIARGLGL